VHAICVAGVAHTNPAAQAFSVSEFEGQNDPGLHAAQVVLALAVHAVVRYVPVEQIEHVVGAVLPLRQKLPAGQLSCTEALGQYDPCAHVTGLV
jgi:hypothetical protein